MAGTTLHGLFETDGFRAGVLSWAAERAGKRWAPGRLDFAAARRGGSTGSPTCSSAPRPRPGRRPDRRGCGARARPRRSSRATLGRGGGGGLAGPAPHLRWRLARRRAAGRRRAGLRRPRRRPRNRFARSPPRPRAGQRRPAGAARRCGGRPTRTGWPARPCLLAAVGRGARRAGRAHGGRHRPQPPLLGRLPRRARGPTAADRGGPGDARRPGCSPVTSTRVEGPASTLRAPGTPSAAR